MSARPLLRSAREAAVWKALADPTRRRLLDELREGARTTGQLAEGFEMTRFGVMKHLGVLVEAGLVRVERRGRERWNHLNAVPIQELYRRWIRPFEAGPADALLRIRAAAERTIREEAMSTEVKDAEFAVVNVVVEVAIDAPPARVWKALMEDTRWWWHKDYYTGPEPRGFVIEAKVGGRMYEDWGDGQGMEWARVIGLRHAVELKFAGQLFPEFGGPASNVTRIALQEREGGTMLTLTDCIYGNVEEKTAKSLDEGWKFLFGEAFKPYVETGERAEIPASVAQEG